MELVSRYTKGAGRRSEPAAYTVVSTSSTRFFVFWLKG
jgi:hypothetical protein